MDRALPLHCLMLSSALLGCRDRSKSEQPEPETLGHYAKAAPARDAGAPDARRDPDALSPAPGTWTYTRPLSRCVVQILASPPSERTKAHDAATARLAPLGGTATVELTFFGDRVARVDLVGAKRPRRAPRTAGEAQLFAVGALVPYADLFGLTVADVMKLSFNTEHITDPGTYTWETYATLERHGNGAIAEIGADELTIDLDRHGAPMGLRLGNGVLPTVTTCSDTLTDDAIRRAVIGARLTWEADGQRYDEGAVESSEITNIQRKVTVVRGSGYDGDVVAGAIYQVTVRKNDTTWWLFVDPSTGDVIETRQGYDD